MTGATVPTGTDYASWLEYIRAGRDGSSRPIGNNTRAELRGEDVAIRLHATDVVTIHPDDSVTYSTGGWYTVTTKDRLNTYGVPGRRVYSERGVWKVSAMRRTDDGRALPEWDARPEPFFDGITFAPDGTCLNPLEPDAAAEAEAEVRKLRRDIGAYAKLCEAEHDPEVLPGGGDCWFCYMRTDDGRSLGDSTGDVEHLRSHMEEGYVVPSLILNALADSGYPDPGLIYRFYGGDMIRRAVRKYLGRRLIDGAPMRGKGADTDGYAVR